MATEEGVALGVFSAAGRNLSLDVPSLGAALCEFFAAGRNLLLIEPSLRAAGDDVAVSDVLSSGESQVCMRSITGSSTTKTL